MNKRNLTKLWASFSDKEKHRAKTEGLFSVDIVLGCASVDMKRLSLLGLEPRHIEGCEFVSGLGNGYTTSSLLGSNACHANELVCKFLGVKVKAGLMVAWQYVILPKDVAHLTLGFERRLATNPRAR